MKYYQTDFLTNPPPIEMYSVDLLISSVPLKIIDNELGLFFGIVNRMMNLNGWILIDYPLGYGQRTLKIHSGSQGSGVQLD